MNAVLLIMLYIAVAAVLQVTAFLVGDPLGDPSPTKGLLILGLFWVALPIAVILFEKSFRRRPRLGAAEPQTPLNVIDLREAVRHRAHGGKGAMIAGESASRVNSSRPAA